MSGTNYGLDEQFYPHLYRGVVKSAPDVDGIIEVLVPQVHGPSDTIPARPCVPPGTTPSPPIGAGVWIMFEAGDPAQPVWMGTWRWG